MDIVQNDGSQGLVERWIKASEDLNRVKLDNRRRLEEIESLRRQREIFKLNYQTEVASHISTCYRALKLSATVDEKDVMRQLGGILEEDTGLEMLETQRQELEKWLGNYIAGEEEFIKQRKATQSELAELQIEMEARKAGGGAYQVRAKGPPDQEEGEDKYAHGVEVVRIRGDGSLSLPKGPRGPKKPFDPSGMLYGPGRKKVARDRVPTQMQLMGTGLQRGRKVSPDPHAGKRHVGEPLGAPTVLGLRGPVVGPSGTRSSAGARSRSPAKESAGRLAERDASPKVSRAMYTDDGQSVFLPQQSADEVLRAAEVRIPEAQRDSSPSRLAVPEAQRSVAFRLAEEEHYYKGAREALDLPPPPPKSQWLTDRHGGSTDTTIFAVEATGAAVVKEGGQGRDITHLTKYRMESAHPHPGIPGQFVSAQEVVYYKNSATSPRPGVQSGDFVQDVRLFGVEKRDDPLGVVLGISDEHKQIVGILRDASHPDHEETYERVGPKWKNLYGRPSNYTSPKSSRPESSSSQQQGPVRASGMGGEDVQSDGGGRTAAENAKLVNEKLVGEEMEDWEIGQNINDKVEELVEVELNKSFPEIGDHARAHQKKVDAAKRKQEREMTGLEQAYELNKVIRKHYLPQMWKP